jgi:hypothetical protein
MLKYKLANKHEENTNTLYTVPNAYQGPMSVNIKLFPAILMTTFVSSLFQKFI